MSQCDCGRQWTRTEEFYLEVQNRWINFIKRPARSGETITSNAMDNKWGRLLDALDECYPSAHLRLAHAFNPEDDVLTRIWLRKR